MAKIRVERVSEQMKQEISTIINQKMKNPQLGFVTVTDVEVTGDLQQATVFVTVYGSQTERDQTLQILEQAKGFIRREVGQVIRLRKVPELAFAYDESIEYGDKIDRLLAKINQSNK